MQIHLLRVVPYLLALPAFAFGYALVLPQDAPPAIVGATAEYTFADGGTLYESAVMEKSTSPYFWLDSGGSLTVGDGVGKTIQGTLPEEDPWRMLYAKNNSLDTDNGFRPQNIFRLITKSSWNDLEESAGFYINADNFSVSPNRNESNGLLLMSRYTDDGQTLYYAGIRVDGTAVIKKKFHGTYYTMAQQQIFPGTYTGGTNLLPHNEWIDLKSETISNQDNSVSVALFMRLPGESDWRELISETDAGQYGGTPPIKGPAYAGIRTDFMDVSFRNYVLAALD
jgi:hypothetical protein